ncbi:elongation factor 2 kinase, putative [Entamoeba dispar SAW760]|uniref:Elongation factor 2 kinase, putative n=1 Tax=Entamoeba dispar (strain ATCC PRA-260 / SAW760) TaxID=370354 RepID=B0ETL8_ENTDS|nr:elongation factor 2 kinase, putative [Entamoeba dispar SAW760]EDR22203.1 elongation factor 2 kinase, putative [Entamoeba dispar SAW760]|eukprot:EDR22203.1 elongation factor 2 kinase, putative [Entamoeba dispar SAW760]
MLKIIESGIKKAQKVKEFKEMQRLKELNDSIHEELDFHEMVRKMRVDLIIIIVEMALLEKDQIESLREKLKLVYDERPKDLTMRILYYNYNKIQELTGDDLINLLQDENKFQMFYDSSMIKKKHSQLEIGFVYKRIKEIKTTVKSKIGLIHFCYSNSVCEQPHQMLNDQYDYYCLMFNDVHHPYRSIPFVKNFFASPPFLNSMFSRCFSDECSSRHCHFINGNYEWSTTKKKPKFEECECHHGIFVDLQQNETESPEFEMCPEFGMCHSGEINMADVPFGVGSVRIAFHGFDMDKKEIIIKQFKTKNMMGFESYVDMVAMHLQCQYVSSLFESYISLLKEGKTVEEITMLDIRTRKEELDSNENRKKENEQKKGNELDSIKRVSFIPLKLFIETPRTSSLRRKFFDSKKISINEIEKMAVDKTIWFIEQPLVGNFEKYNSNNSDVNYCNYSYTMQCFSHFSYFISKKSFIITDLQGIFNKEKNLYELTDPAIHHQFLSPYFFAFTNLGNTGINQFFITHKCNKYCTTLQLPPHPFQPTELYK